MGGTIWLNEAFSELMCSSTKQLPKIEKTEEDNGHYYAHLERWLTLAD